MCSHDFSIEEDLWHLQSMCSFDFCLKNIFHCKVFHKFADNADGCYFSVYVFFFHLLYCCVCCYCYFSSGFLSILVWCILLFQCLLVLIIQWQYMCGSGSGRRHMQKLRNMSTNSLLKKMFLERFDEHLPFFKFKYDFNAFCYSKFPDFENLYTHPSYNK